MGLRSALRNGFTNPSSLPSWWSLVGAVSIAVFVLYAAIQAIPGGGESSPNDPTVPATVPGITTPAPTTPGSTLSSGTVAVPAADGTTLELPVAAAQTARSAARALFTGDLSTVTLAPGSAFPSIGRTWPDPQVSDPVQAAPNGSGFRLLFDVDPDGAGPEVARRLGIDILESSGGWVVRF